MDKSRQTQSAGDNSTQMQAGTINYNVTFTGIDEAAARRICQQEYAIARQNWTEEAIKIADDRARQLENKLMPKMIEYDSTLSIFADPAFQLTIREAQISAAASERESDYEILSELMLHRAQHNDDRTKRLGISEAIKIVDKVSDEALVALATIYAMIRFSPMSEDTMEGLNVLNNLFKSILDRFTLPANNDWEEHLDLLSAIRIGYQEISQFKKAKDWIPLKLKKYLVSGVLDDSPELRKVKDDFCRCGIPLTCIIPHPLKPGYVRLNNSLTIEDMRIIQERGSVTIKSPLNIEQKEAMKKAIEILRKDESNNETMKAQIINEWDKFPILKTIHTWWDSLTGFVTITPVGMALANAYIKSKYPNIPSLY